ncbi:MAG: hypothetical protein IJV64_09895 [Oscillospiraceae bacterium]|nr:hypothetical protein [Oscillospiraceae bacterium]
MEQAIKILLIEIGLILVFGTVGVAIIEWDFRRDMKLSNEELREKYSRKYGKDGTDDSTDERGHDAGHKRSAAVKLALPSLIGFLAGIILYFLLIGIERVLAK